MESYNLTIEQDTLSRLTGYAKSAEIAAFLAKNGVPFFRGKRGKVFTTVAAVNSALGVFPNKQFNEFGAGDLIEVL